MSNVITRKNLLNVRLTDSTSTDDNHYLAGGACKAFFPLHIDGASFDEEINGATLSETISDIDGSGLKALGGAGISAGIFSSGYTALGGGGSIIALSAGRVGDYAKSTSAGPGMLLGFVLAILPQQMIVVLNRDGTVNFTVSELIDNPFTPNFINNTSIAMKYPCKAGDLMWIAVQVEDVNGTDIAVNYADSLGNEIVLGNAGLTVPDVPLALNTFGPSGTIGGGDDRAAMYGSGLFVSDTPDWKELAKKQGDYWLAGGKQIIPELIYLQP